MQEGNLTIEDILNGAYKPNEYMDYKDIRISIETEHINGVTLFVTKHINKRTACCKVQINYFFIRNTKDPLRYIYNCAIKAFEQLIEQKL